MDLSTQFPRSPYDMNAGLVMLPRTMDKCRAHLAGTLGEYYYNCPLDELLFEFLGIDADAFAKTVESGAGGEAEIAEWIESHCARSRAEKDAFNSMIRHLVP